jgi:MarR family transcriptional regulator, lower aerobic nicotinate degradation pathway regulator
MTAKIARPPCEIYCLDEQVGFLLRQVSQRHTAIFASRIGGNITPTQWAVLSKLLEAGPLSQNHLGRLTAMDVATAKGVVGRLEARGLIVTKPDSSDARRRLVALTTEGRAFAESRIGNALAITEETLSPLDEPERASLLALLDKMK